MFNVLKSIIYMDDNQVIPNSLLDFVTSAYNIYKISLVVKVKLHATIVTNDMDYEWNLLRSNPKLSINSIQPCRLNS